MTDSFVGRTLGRFLIQHKLGEGGMGVVYLAEDPDLRRRVAIKVLPEALLAEPSRQQRFLREARSAARLSHPNIAAIFEIGQAEGHTFIVMEYITGQSMRSLLMQLKPTLAYALRYAKDLASAAASAHAAGVIHRDLKPENIMIDESGRLRVLDFGIAKLEAEPGSETGAQEFRTQGNGVLGTPGYMSPEQLAGSTVDSRTDVFAIGVILYELLTRARPFDGQTPMEVMIATARDQPRPPSAIDAGVPEAVDRLVLSCLAKRPEERPQNAASLVSEIEQLERAFAHTVLHEGSGSLPPFQAALVATPPAAVLSQAPLQKSSGVLAVVIAFGLACVAALGIGGFFIATRQPSAPSPVTSEGAPKSALREPKAGLETIARYERPKDSRTSATSIPAWATAARDFEDAAKQPGAPARWTAALHLSNGKKAHLEGNLEGAKRALDQAIAADAKWYVPHVALSEVHSQAKKKREALAAAERAQLLEPTAWIGIVVAARAYASENEFDSAIAEYRRALEKAPNTPVILSGLALVYHAANMDQEAKRYADMALARDPDLVSVNILLAERALEKNDGKTALSHAERAIGVEPQDISAWLAKADALALLGRGKDARSAYEKTLQLVDKTKARGAAEARLALVRKALAQNTLPAARVIGNERSVVPKAAPTRSTKPSQVGF